MLVLFLVLCALALALFALGLHYDLHQRRLAREQLFALDWLQDYSGIVSQAQLEQLLGKACGHELYRIEPQVFAKLPRSLWARGLYFPALNLAAGLGVIFALLQTLLTGAPAWVWLALCGGYIGLSLLWDIAWELIKLRASDRSEEPKDDDQPQSLDGMIEMLARERHHARAETALELGTEANCAFFKWVARQLGRWQERFYSKKLEQLRSLQLEHSQSPDELRALLVKVRWRIADLERTETPAPDVLQELQALEAQLDELIGEPTSVSS